MRYYSTVYMEIFKGHKFCGFHCLLSAKNISKGSWKQCIQLDDQQKLDCENLLDLPSADPQKSLHIQYLMPEKSYSLIPYFCSTNRWIPNFYN